MPRLIGFLFMVALLVVLPDATSAADKPDLSLDEIIQKIEARYASSGFTARFLQESTIKALEITDMASGVMTVKRPGKMRWEYIQPEKQLIITDGQTLWAYRPDDNQVMVGKSPFFFGEGKGAGFLSDIRQIQEQFVISLAPSKMADTYRLKLIPLEPTLDLFTTFMLISADDFKVYQIITYNVYEDETRITLTDIEFKTDIDDALFTFQIPDGVEIIKLDE